MLGSLQPQDNQLAPAQVSLERYVALRSQTADAENRPGLDQAYLSLSQLAEKRKDYAAAESWLGKIENSSDLAQAQTRRASILASQGKLEEGRKLIRQLPERTPEDARMKINAEVGPLRAFKQSQPAPELRAQERAKPPDPVYLPHDQTLSAATPHARVAMQR